MFLGKHMFYKFLDLNKFQLQDHMISKCYTILIISIIHVLHKWKLVAISHKNTHLGTSYLTLNPKLDFIKYNIKKWQKLSTPCEMYHWNDTFHNVQFVTYRLVTHEYQVGMARVALKSSLFWQLLIWTHYLLYSFAFFDLPNYSTPICVVHTPSCIPLYYTLWHTEKKQVVGIDLVYL